MTDLDFRSLVRPGDKVCWPQAAAEPLTLTRRLVEQRAEIGNFTAMIGISWAETVDVKYTDYIRYVSYGAMGTARKVAAAGKLDILPVHYSSLWKVLEQQVDVLLLQLSPADAQGRHSFGMAQELYPPLLDSARIVIAEINDQVPFVYSDRLVHRDELDVVIHTSRPPLDAPAAKAGPADAAIARNVAALVTDGAVIQIGIGALPDLITRELSGHRRLGIHSGLINDGLVALMESGVVTNETKTLDRGIATTGLFTGTEKLRRFVHENPRVALRSTPYVHGVAITSQLDGFTAINSALEVDLSGQISSEVIGQRHVGTVGGGVDFLRGAAAARNGVPIVALSSTATDPSGKVVSRIVPRFDGPVTTARSDAGFIVTEHGSVDLRALTLSERKRALISIAAPEFRESLERG